MTITILGGSGPFHADKMKLKKGLAYFYRRDGFMLVKICACPVERIHSVVYE